MQFVDVKGELEKKKKKMSRFGLVVEGISEGLMPFGVGRQFCFLNFIAFVGFRI